MKTIIKITLLLILIFSSLNIHSQDKFTLKTTESYLLEMPLTYGDFIHNDSFITWVFDLYNKKIVYQNSTSTKTFYYSSMEINEHSTDENAIIHFDNSKENITVIQKNGNYIKIKFSYDKVPNTNPASHRKLKIYTNYVINDYSELLSN